MASKPTGVVIIAIVTCLIGISYLASGIYMILLGEQIMGFGALGYSLGKMIEALSVIWLLLAGVSMIIGLGLFTMKEWARALGVHFYEVLALMCFLMFILNPILLLYGILYLIFFMHLKKASTRNAFEYYGYEKPKIPQKRTSPVYTHQRTPSQQPVISLSAKKDIKVPDNMILCPGCQTLNLKGKRYCKTCAGELKE